MSYTSAWSLRCSITDVSYWVFDLFTARLRLHSSIGRRTGKNLSSSSSSSSSSFFLSLKKKYICRHCRHNKTFHDTCLHVCWKIKSRALFLFFCCPRSRYCHCTGIQCWSGCLVLCWLTPCGLICTAYLPCVTPHQATHPPLAETVPHLRCDTSVSCSQWCEM